MPAAANASVVRVLLVDSAPEVRETLSRWFAGPAVSVVQAGTLAAARQALTEAPADLAVIETELPDGQGLELVAEVSRARPGAQAILMSSRPGVRRVVEALRAGAADFFIKPLDASEVSPRINEALARRADDRARDKRIRRLRRICRKLSASRDEIAQQVDVLCTDLVGAYQELANQVQHLAEVGDFTSIIRHELDLEALLRRTLEYLLAKGGPTNAAVFLPSTADEFTLGGYVNYDCTAESADVLLEHLADVVAPKLAGREGVLHVTDNAALAAWIGDDAAYLADSHVLAFACRREGETLAVVTLFRDGNEPFTPGFTQVCSAIAPLLADHLARIIRVHHRALGSDA